MATTEEMRARVRTKLAEATESYYLDTEVDEAVTDALLALWPIVFDETYQDINLAADANQATLPTDADGAYIQGLTVVEIQCPYLSDSWEVLERSAYHVLKDKIAFGSANSSGVTIVVRIHYKGKWTLTTLRVALEEVAALYAAGRCLEKRLGTRVKFTDVNADMDITSVTAGDLIGVAGYFMYQFRLALAAQAGIEPQDIIMEENAPPPKRK